MTSIVIEDLWKEYRLGVIGHGTLTHDLQSWWARARGKEDPNAMIKSFLAGQEKQVDGDHFWALRGVNLEVKEGEVVGIIGKNGAGKSTLLKVLSRVTAPTRGTIKVKGRIASLLEVGTGFHPELTGRENIFMNGAILGMSKKEIRAKLDEIIDFSGVEQFVDTPVKRYSSGMYVRLAFAVAAHLEPEILVVDEVLAVGDVEFQKKCLGKLHEVATAGRTVLFVSHNMGAVTQLCSKGVILEHGLVAGCDDIAKIVRKYLCSSEGKFAGKLEWRDDSAGEAKIVKLMSVGISRGGIHSSALWTDESFEISIEIKVSKPKLRLGVGVKIINSLGQCIVHSSSLVSTSTVVNEGNWLFKGRIPANVLSSGDYFLTISADEPNKEIFFLVENVIRFSVETRSTNSSMYPRRTWTGALCPEIVNWIVVSEEKRKLQFVA